MAILEFKNTTEMKNSLDGHNRFKMAEERINESENKQKMTNRKEKKTEDEHSLRELWDKNKQC